MNHRFFMSVVTASLLTTNVAAGTMADRVADKDWRWVGTVSLGPVWARAGETQTFFLAPDMEQTYLARKSTNTLALGEVFLGLQKNILSSNWHAQFGVAAATMSHDTLQGNIWEDADPEFDNYTYQYKIRATRVAAKVKLLLDKGYWFTPWVSASLGASFNKAYDFTNTPLIIEALPNANFTNHTETSLTYTFGVGVQKVLNAHWQVGVGYEFADWGKSQLGSAFGQTMNTGLSLNHLYTNGVLFNLTYIT